MCQSRPRWCSMRSCASGAPKKTHPIKHEVPSPETFTKNLSLALRALRLGGELLFSRPRGVLDYELRFEVAGRAGAAPARSAREDHPAQRDSHAAAGCRAANFLFA